MSPLLFLSLLFKFSPLQLPDSSITPFIIVLGIAQDAGYPQAGCEKGCCRRAWNDPSLKRFATSFALVDPQTKKWWLFEATPDLREQVQLFYQLTNAQYPILPTGVFLTHAHIGHYTGLMQFGREVMSTKELPVFAMPRMKNYLSTNGPWSQLVSLKNIVINDLHADSTIHLSSNISITPFLVPHRDEYSETVGFNINCNQFKVLFIPDINKWNIFDRSINDLVHASDLALLDGTFFKEGELPDRSMKDIPHPFVQESMQQFASLSAADKKKIRFIHFNHTNPLLNESSPEYQSVLDAGFGIAKQGERMELK